MKRRLEINWMELDAAFQTGSWEMQSYLDLETGDVVAVTDEASRYLEEPPDRELPDWMQEMLEVAKQVEKGYGTRYISILQADSHEDYRDMERLYLLNNVGQCRRDFHTSQDQHDMEIAATTQVPRNIEMIRAFHLHGAQRSPARPAVASD